MLPTASFWAPRSPLPETPAFRPEVSADLPLSTPDPTWPVPHRVCNFKRQKCAMQIGVDTVQTRGGSAADSEPRAFEIQW